MLLDIHLKPFESIWLVNQAQAPLTSEALILTRLLDYFLGLPGCYRGYWDLS